MNYVAIGNRIRSIRKQRKLTQRELADLTYLSETCISNIENGKKKVSLESLVAVSDALHVSIDLLISGTMVRSGRSTISLDFLTRDCTDAEKKFMYDSLSVILNALKANRISI